MFQVIGTAIHKQGARWNPWDNFYDAIHATQEAMLNEPADVYSWWCNLPSESALATGAMGGLCSDYNTNLNGRQEGDARNGMVSDILDKQLT